MTDLTQTNNNLLKMLQDRSPGYHPLIAMLDLSLEANTEDGIKLNCHKEIAKYVEPQLKAVEHRGTVKADFGTLRVIPAEVIEIAVQSQPDASEQPPAELNNGATASSEAA